MDFILIVALQAFCCWIAFKIGENIAYFRIAKGLMDLKEAAGVMETVEETKGTATIEKIGDQYYAYIGNDFVGQGSTLDEVHDVVKKTIEKNPNKFIASLKAQAVDKV